MSTEDLFRAFSIKCRGCLVDSGEMKNMSEWGLCEDFYKFTDIKVNRSEGLTELLCTACEDTLKKCKSFRTQCLRSDVILRTSSSAPKEKPATQQRIEATTKATNHEIESRERKLEENFMNSVVKDKEIIMMLLPARMDTKFELPCPLDCKRTYSKRKDLMSHLAKHNISKTTVLTLQYYCPYVNCAYFIDSGRNKWFTERKFLNQHISKVHEEKHYACAMCKSTFAKDTDLYRHLKCCNDVYECDVCGIKYKKKETYLVHLLRKHPELHKEYKSRSKRERNLKRISRNVNDTNKTVRNDDTGKRSNVAEYACGSPKKSFATQTFKDDVLKNDVIMANLDNEYGKNSNEIETQTVFEDLLSLKSQNSEDDSLFFSDSVSDIQTQTWPLEFGISRINKETNTCQSPDFTIKETQTCMCLYDTPKPTVFNNCGSAHDKLTSAETQTAELFGYSTVKSDVLLSFNSAQTQTSFEEAKANDSL